MTIESFDDDTVIEPTAHVGNSKQPDGIDTFDSDEPIALPAAEEKKVTQVQKMDDKEEEKKEEEEEEEEEEDEPKEEAKEEVKQEAPKGKTLRLKDESGNSTDISEDSTVKVKVNGKNEFVPVKELMANYSGKVAWESKFSQVKEEKTKIQAESSRFQQEKEEVVSHLTKIADMLDSDDKNPLDALNYLVDITGRDTLKFTKKVMDYLSGEVLALESMDDVERELYWKNKEVETYKNNQSAKAEQLSKTQAEKERIAKVDQLRESNGVSVDDFLQSAKELKALGYADNQINPDNIVKYAVMKPFYEKAEDLVKEVEDDLSDDQIEKLISTVANTMKSFPRISKEKALEISIEELGWSYDYEDDFKELNEKAQPQKGSKKNSEYSYGRQAEDKIESFDDFEF